MSNAAGGSALGLVFLLHSGGSCPPVRLSSLWFTCREPYTALRQMPAKTAAVATSVAVSDYALPLSMLVHQFKFVRRPEMANALARLLVLAVINARRTTQWQKPDMLISVPLYRHRQWRRGYNQSDLLCRALAHWLCCRYEPSAIVRIRATSIQHHLSARLRKRNLKNAFRLELPVQGLHMVIVDDVVTTGSTVAEISRLLLRNGAASVQVWCLCRTL